MTLSLPTAITVGRLLLAAASLALLFVPGPDAKLACLILFLIASFSDWLDGYLARKLHQITPLGVLLDPIADKVLVLGLLAGFLPLGLAPAWMVAVIVAREVLVTWARLDAARRKVVIPAAKEGKQKAAAQMAAIVAGLVLLLLRARPDTAASPWTLVWMPRVLQACLWVAVVLTVISGVSFFRRHRAVLNP